MSSFYIPCPLLIPTATFQLLIIPPFTFDRSSLSLVYFVLRSRDPATSLSVSSPGQISFRTDPNRNLGSDVVYFVPGAYITITGLPLQLRQVSSLSMAFHINADPGQNSNVGVITFFTLGVGEGFRISISGGTTLVVESGNNPTLSLSGTITPGTWNIVIIIFNRITGQFILIIDGTTVRICLHLYR